MPMVYKLKYNSVFKLSIIKYPFSIYMLNSDLSTALCYKMNRIYKICSSKDNLNSDPFKMTRKHVLQNFISSL